MQQFKAMMSDKEVEIIESLLKPEFDCLEFGSGYSTVYFPQFVSSWTSIEHDDDWFFKVINMIEFDSMKTKIIKASESDYLTSVLRLGKKYDFILVDGIRRKECLDLAFKLIKPNGIILLHDAIRFEYKDWVDKYPNKTLIEGEMPDENHKGYYLIRGIKAYINENKGLLWK